jgi:hypothetical protein
VTGRQTRSKQPVYSDWDEPRRFGPLEEEPARSNAGYAVAFLLAAALLVMCVAGYLVVKVLLPTSSPTSVPLFATWTPSPQPGSPSDEPTAPPTTIASGQQALVINPEQGYINTLVTVTGQGWWPGEPVFIFLRSPEEGNGRGYSYAAAVADDQGNIRTALTFPNEVRWIDQPWADVIARGNRSGLEASARFTLVAPTPTDTPLPPTPRPTRAPTETPLPTEVPLPTNTPTPEVVITDWQSEYFANTSLTGDPVFVRNDTDIDFDWGTGSPGSGLPADQFGVRWTRLLHFRQGTYHFTVTADDGVRLWIDGQFVLNEWHDGSMTPYSVDLYLPRGDHSLQLEYYENLGGAAIKFTWTRYEQPTETPTPTLTPTPSATPSPTSTSIPPLPQAWQAEFYDNPSLVGLPVLVREDADVNFDWGAGSPDGSLPADNFSARWTRSIWLAAGTYRFTVSADDGVRLWLDGVPLIDQWHVSTGDIYVVETPLTEGVHLMRIEYYEATLDARIHFASEFLSNPALAP